MPPGGAKLCPYCGYPLLLDRPAEVLPEAHKNVYKPTAPQEEVGSTTRVGYPAPGGFPPAAGFPPQAGPYGQPVRYGQPERMRVPGPHCPHCRTVNPSHRKRCEVCGYELWPGSAAPAPWMPQPPAIAPAPPRRRSWWKIPLLIGIPLLVMATVWVLALVL